jgi:hypothetical protein
MQGCVYVMYYFTIITSVMMPRRDLGETNQPCLRAGYHNKLTNCNITCTKSFQVHITIKPITIF